MVWRDDPGTPTPCDVLCCPASPPPCTPPVCLPSPPHPHPALPTHAHAHRSHPRHAGRVPASIFCKLKAYDTRRARECLRNKRIVLLGDSTMVRPPPPPPPCQSCAHDARGKEGRGATRTLGQDGTGRWCTIVTVAGATAQAAAARLGLQTAPASYTGSSAGVFKRATPWERCWGVSILVGGVMGRVPGAIQGLP